jgi:hypothetical protein
MFYVFSLFCLCMLFPMDDSGYINWKSMVVKSAWSLNGKGVKV